MRAALVTLLWALLPVLCHAETVTIKGADGRGKATYQVEIAQTPKEAERGLMFRKTLAKDHGMLFRFMPPRPVAMWMKNTYVPLDVLFTDASGRIIHIERDMIPHDLTPRGPQGADVAMALEIPAGGAKRAKIGLQDRLAISSGKQ